MPPASGRHLAKAAAAVLLLALLLPCVAARRAGQIQKPSIPINNYLDLRPCDMWGPYVKNPVYPDKHLEALEAVIKANKEVEKLKSIINIVGKSYPPYTSVAASLITDNLETANEALAAYQQSISYMREYVAAAIVEYNADLMNANVMSDYNAYKLALQRYGATQDVLVRARNLEQALTLCHRMRSRLSDWRAGEDFGKAQPLQPHQAFNWVATIGTTCLTTEYLLWKLHPESKLTNADLVRHELSEWQSLANAAVRDLYAGAHGQLPTPTTELRLSGGTSTIRQLRLEAFGQVQGPRPVGITCFPQRTWANLWMHEMRDSITHTKFTVTYLAGGMCIAETVIGSCPIPRPRYSYDVVRNPGEALYYYLGVYDSFKARAANELMAKLEPYMQLVWSWQFVVNPKMGLHVQTLYMGPFGIRDLNDEPADPKFETLPRSDFPDFTNQQFVRVSAFTKSIIGLTYITGVEIADGGAPLGEQVTVRCTGVCSGSPAKTAVVTGNHAFFGRVFVSRVEVDYDSAPRYLALHLAGGLKFEVGEVDRRCGGKSPMDCASFDSDRLLPPNAYEDTRVGRRIRFFNLHGTWGRWQGALVQLLPRYGAYRPPVQL